MVVSGCARVRNDLKRPGRALLALRAPDTRCPGHPGPSAPRLCSSTKNLDCDKPDREEHEEMKAWNVFTLTAMHTPMMRRRNFG